MSLPERHDAETGLKVAVLAASPSQFVQLKAQLQPHHVEVVCEIQVDQWRPDALPGRVDVLLVEMSNEEQIPEAILDGLLEQTDPPVLFNDSDTARFSSMRSGEQVWGRKLAEKLRALAMAPRTRPQARVQPRPTAPAAGCGGVEREAPVADNNTRPSGPEGNPAVPATKASPRPERSRPGDADGESASARGMPKAPAPSRSKAAARPVSDAGPGPAPAPPGPGRRQAGASPEVWVLAASIGGPQVVKEFLAAFETPVPAIFVLAQHIGSGFIRLLAEQLDQAGVLKVSIAEEGVRPRPGHVYVAPVDHELGLTPEGRWRLRKRHRKGLYAPSIDQVMQTLAEHFVGRTHAMVFSGMGGDGLEGCRYIHQGGGEIWVQEPNTCVVSAMVDAVCRNGLHGFTGSPQRLAQRLATRLHEEAREPS